jgi:hypothetical protein
MMSNRAHDRICTGR